METRRWIWAIGAMVALSALPVLDGCAPLSRPSTASHRASSSVGEGVLALAATSSSLSVSTPTVSRALDRIDQRTPALDSTYRHIGTGRGVTVYVFDGGVSTSHPELAGRVRAGYSAFPSDPSICNAHGTAVAGAIAGSTLGVAPEAEIVDVKMVECATLRGTVRAIVDGARWVIADHQRHGGPAVVNWSFIADTSAELLPIDSAVTMLRDAGMAVIVSAGNYDIDACRVSPGNSRGTVVVGSASLVIDSSSGIARALDRRTPDTAWGWCVDLYAPGDGVLLPSLDEYGRPITQAWNGTSMSTGYVSGAAALYLQLEPRATADQVTAYLRATATKNAIGNSRSESTWLLYVGPPDQR